MIYLVTEVLPYGAAQRSLIELEKVSMTLTSIGAPGASVCHNHKEKPSKINYVSFQCDRLVTH